MYKQGAILTRTHTGAQLF